MTKLNKKGYGETGFNFTPQPLIRQPQPTQQPGQTRQPEQTTVPQQYAVTNSQSFAPPQTKKPGIFQNIPLIVCGTILTAGSVLAIGAAMNPSITYSVKKQFGRTDAACSNLEGKFYNGSVMTVTKNLIGVDTLNVCVEGLVVASDSKVKTGNSLLRGQEFTLAKASETIAPELVVSQELTINSEVIPIINNRFTYKGKTTEVPKGAAAAKINDVVGFIKAVEPYTLIEGQKEMLNEANGVFTPKAPQPFSYVFSPDGKMKFTTSNLSSKKSKESLGSSIAIFPDSKVAANIVTSKDPNFLNGAKIIIK
jgi:hypothetical protein